jgi:hypothetical protein
MQPIEPLGSRPQIKAEHSHDAEHREGHDHATRVRPPVIAKPSLTNALAGPKALVSDGLTVWAGR